MRNSKPTKMYLQKNVTDIFYGKTMFTDEDGEMLNPLKPSVL